MRSESSVAVASGFDPEDEAVLAHALALPGAGRVLSVGSVGERVLALWLAGHRVRCVATGEPQHALVALKGSTAALRYLEGRQLVGLDRAGRRVFLYHEVRDGLDGPAQAFWDEREALVREGVLSIGALDVAARRLHGRLRGLGRGEDWRRRLFEDGSPPRGLRWRLALRVMERPEQSAAALAARIGALAGSGSPRSNRWLQSLLLGGIRFEEGLPHWLTAAGHEELGARSEGLEWVDLGDVGGGLDGVDLGSFGEDEPDPTPLVTRLGAACRPGARLVWWTFRHAPLAPPSPWRALPEEERRVATLDRSPFSGSLRIWERA